MSFGKAVDYESDRLTSEYLHFHYGSPQEVYPWGSELQRVASYAERVISERFPAEMVERGLEVGCAVGRSSFEMARYCREVVGIDYSEKFIQTAESLRQGGELNYSLAMQGERSREFTARAPEGVDRSRVRFQTGDAHALPEYLGEFDWVLGANLLCRLHHPRRFLSQLPHLVRAGGVLVLNSPFTWMEEHTDPAEWIGGKAEGGDSATELKALLDPHFELVDECSMPFLIRETERKYQLTVAHSGKWRRR
ncbi:MAG: putative 4-mercaptohistidine N1-methyltransferase [Puniceicoccales bacterium]